MRSPIYLLVLAAAAASVALADDAPMPERSPDPVPHARAPGAAAVPATPTVTAAAVPAHTPPPDPAPSSVLGTPLFDQAFREEAAHAAGQPVATAAASPTLPTPVPSEPARSAADAKPFGSATALADAIPHPAESALVDARSESLASAAAPAAAAGLMQPPASAARGISAAAPPMPAALDPASQAFVDRQRDAELSFAGRRREEQRELELIRLEAEAAKLKQQIREAVAPVSVTPPTVFVEPQGKRKGEEPPPPPPPPPPQLKGTAGGYALLSYNGSDYRVAVGDKVGRYRVLTVGTGTVRLQNGKDSVDLRTTW